MSDFGVPYQGRKSRLVRKIVPLLPSGDRFVDVFAGGCSVTHGALIAGRWGEYVANDVNDVPSLFLSAIRGDFRNETRWVSRETFFAEKDADPYIRVCWSFGNNMENYMYSREIEPWKEAYHRAVFFGDMEAFKAMGIVGLHAYGNTPAARYASLCRQIGSSRRYLDIYRRWAGEVLFALKGQDLENAIARTSEMVTAEADELRAYLCDALRRSGARARDVDELLGTNGMAGHYFGASQWEFPTPEAYARMQARWPEFDRPYSTTGAYLGALQRLESLQSLQRLQRLESLQRLTVTRGDYRELDIHAGDVVYCDPPYKDTAGYGVDFDHAAFYDWVEALPVPAYVSEYSMPEDRFECIASFSLSVYAQGGSGAKKDEKIYIAKKWI